MSQDSIALRVQQEMQRTQGLDPQALQVLFVAQYIMDSSAAKEGALLKLKVGRQWTLETITSALDALQEQLKKADAGVAETFVRQAVANADEFLASLTSIEASMFLGILQGEKQEQATLREKGARISQRGTDVLNFLNDLLPATPLVQTPAPTVPGLFGLKGRLNQVMQESGLFQSQESQPPSEEKPRPGWLTSAILNDEDPDVQKFWIIISDAVREDRTPAEAMQDIRSMSDLTPIQIKEICLRVIELGRNQVAQSAEIEEFIQGQYQGAEDAHDAIVNLSETLKKVRDFFSPGGNAQPAAGPA